MRSDSWLLSTPGRSTVVRMPADRGLHGEAWAPKAVQDPLPAALSHRSHHTRRDPIAALSGGLRLHLPHAWRPERACRPAGRAGGLHHAARRPGAQHPAARLGGQAAAACSR